MVTTVAASAVTISTAATGGNVTDDGGSEVTARGVCWNVTEDPEVTDRHTTDGAGPGAFISSLTQLDPSKRYYVRAYATNSAGTSYGNQVKFVTQSNSGINFNPNLTYDTVFGISGRAYKTVNINLKKNAQSNFGPEEKEALVEGWMVENLNETYFNDNQQITWVLDNTQWRNLTTPAYCYYPSANSNTYGALYNWYAVETGRLCPEGWRVPTWTDWYNLIDALGGEKVAGGKLKEEGYAHWLSHNTGATNSSGFRVFREAIVMITE